MHKTDKENVNVTSITQAYGYCYIFFFTSGLYFNISHTQVLFISYIYINNPQAESETLEVRTSLLVSPTCCDVNVLTWAYKT